jgi:hypothetical protein
MGVRGSEGKLGTVMDRNSVEWWKWGLWRSGGRGWQAGVDGGAVSTAGRVMRRVGGGDAVGSVGKWGRDWLRRAKGCRGRSGCARFQEMRGRVLENGGKGGELQWMELGGISSYPEATVTATECK